MTHATTVHERIFASAVIIVVDDDEAVRDSLKFSLEAEGYSVLVYGDASALLSHAEIPDCHCMVIDQAMPDITGIDLIDELRIRRKKAPAILITTHPSNNLARRAAATGIPIVEKPLLGTALIDAIRKVMANPL